MPGPRAVTGQPGWKPDGARFTLHKERVLRLVSAMCGSASAAASWSLAAFPAFPRKRAAEILAGLAPLEQQVTADMRALLGTSSFLGRLRGTGPLTPARGREHGAPGPIGKASGFADDTRLIRPTTARGAGPRTARHAFGRRCAGEAQGAG
jgi:formate hydrogenlyase subunit 5